jgi:hypothetical protein
MAPQLQDQFIRKNIAGQNAIVTSQRPTMQVNGYQPSSAKPANESAQANQVRETGLTNLIEEAFN